MVNLLMRKASKLVTAVQDSISTCVRVKTQDILKATTGQFLAIVVLTKKFFFFFLARAGDVSSLVCGSQNKIFSKPNQEGFAQT